jgi:hypothetical protein
MPRTEVQEEAINLIDQIKMCGKAARADLNRMCKERGIEDACFSHEFTELHLEIAKEVFNLWHTTKNFKVGDKVYVVPLTPTVMDTCIRATVTEITDDGWGYHLRAFESDLPGIFMFNIWDKDLHPRTSKAIKPTPSELLIRSGK